MKHSLDRTTQRRAVEIAVIYAALGLAWIVITDVLVERNSVPPGVRHFLQSWKGSLFVVATAAMLHLLLAHSFKSLEASQRRVETLLSQLRSLATHERTSREEERARISRDLHDELGQQLTGLKFDVAALAAGGRGHDAGDAGKRLDDLAVALDEAIRTVRRISTELRPGVLDQLGLAAALEWLAADYSRRSGIRAAVQVADAPVPEEVATAAFRVVQESLTNVARHSGATEFSASLVRSPSGVLLTIRDNGRGYSGKQGFGVLGMRERVTTIGGLFEIGPGPDGAGTEVHCSIPLTKESAA